MVIYLFSVVKDVLMFLFCLLDSIWLTPEFTSFFFLYVWYHFKQLDKINMFGLNASLVV